MLSVICSLASLSCHHSAARESYTDSSLPPGHWAGPRVCFSTHSVVVQPRQLLERASSSPELGMCGQGKKCRSLCMEEKIHHQLIFIEKAGTVRITNPDLAFQEARSKIINRIDLGALTIRAKCILGSLFLRKRELLGYVSVLGLCTSLDLPHQGPWLEF